MTSDVEARPFGIRQAAPRRTPRSTRERADQTASWPAILGWGAGLIVTAVGAGALTGNELTPLGIRLLGAPLALVGLATIGWGTAVLSRGAIVLGRSAVVGCLVALALTITAFAIDPVGTSIGAVAAASALLLALAMLIAFRLRRPAPAGRRTGIAGILVAAVVVAALTGPSLTAAAAARSTQGNAGVPVVIPSHH